MKLFRSFDHLAEMIGIPIDRDLGNCQHPDVALSSGFTVHHGSKADYRLRDMNSVGHISGVRIPLDRR